MGVGVNQIVAYHQVFLAEHYQFIIFFLPTKRP